MHLGEVLRALDSADDEEAGSGSDSDYEEKTKIPNATSANDGDIADEVESDGHETEVHEAGNSEDSNYGDGEEMDDGPSGGEEDETSELTELVKPPKFRRNYDLRTKRVVPLWLYGFKTTFDSWEEFHEAFDDFQVETFQQFSKRTNTSVDIRNKPIIRLSARKLAGKKARKDVTLVPDEWRTYSKLILLMTQTQTATSYLASSFITFLARLCRDRAHGEFAKGSGDLQGEQS